MVLTGSGFVGVTQAISHGTPAAFFAIQSPTHLTAVVPMGTMAGPISVQTGAGTGNSGTIFQPMVLAATGTLARKPFQAWSNPVHASELLHLYLPIAYSPTTITWVELRNVLGQLVREGSFRG